MENELEQRYMLRMAAAYYRGRALRTGEPSLDDALLRTPLDALEKQQLEKIAALGSAALDKLYYFKRTHEEMPRVKRVLGFLRSAAFDSLLDVGSGRGVFLLPFLEQFPWVSVKSLDVLPHRVEFLNDLRAGGVSALTAELADICTADIPDRSVDIVTMLEVLEHIEQVDKAIARAVRIARRHVVVSVPSKEDNNPEHIHLLTKPVLTELFEKAGCTRLRFDGVNGHLILVATIEKQGGMSDESV